MPGHNHDDRGLVPAYVPTCPMYNSLFVAALHLAYIVTTTAVGTAA